MPAIILFGRGWLFSSDDLVFSSVFIIFVRLALTLSAAIPFILFCSDGLTCLPRTLAYLSCSGFGVSVLQLILRCVLAIASASGGISDVSRRTSVAKILYAHLFMMPIEIGIYASIIYLEATSKECITNICLVLRIVCIIAEAFVAANIISFIMQYDSAGRVWKDTPGLWCMAIDKEAATLNRAKAHYLYARLWNRRLRCLACLRNSCRNTDRSSKNSDQLTVLLVSDIAGHFFMTNMVASDLIAGLVLLRWQTHQWVGCGHHVPMSCILRDTEPYNPHPNSAPLSMGGNQTTTMGSKPSDQLQAEWLSVSRIHAYSKFASAVYGRLLYVFEHRLALPALCALCKEISCKTCCCCCLHPRTTASMHNNDVDRETDPILQPSDDLQAGCCICEHDNCNYAVFSRVTGVPISDLIYYSFTNTVYFSPFLVAIDEKTRSIVIAVRGTLSIEDMIVDMLAEGARVQEEDLGPTALGSAEFVVHMGMLRTARQLRTAILEMRLVEKARRRRPNYPLVVCGHSLGAGVASVLALLLRSYYPEVKAYAYSPPLGLMSAPLAHFCKPFVCSVVYGYDIIPRLSIPTLNDLKWRLFDALANCKIPKYQLLCRSAKLLFLRCCLPCCSWPMIGLDTKLLDEKMQQRLLNPEVYQARISSYSTSSEPSELPGLRSRGPLLTASSPPAPGGRRVSAARSTNQNCAPGDVPSYSRFRPGPRSLVCWLKDSGPLILKTAAPGTEFCPPYADLEGNVQPQWSEFSSTSAPTGEYASAASYEELVSMDRNVKFAGVVLHIVEADDCLSAAESSDSLDFEASSPWLPENHQQKTSRKNPRTAPVAVWSSARQFQTILVHPRMLQDHLPNSITGALERLYRASLPNLTTSQGAGLLPAGLSDPAHLVRRIKHAERS